MRTSRVVARHYAPHLTVRRGKCERLFHSFLLLWGSRNLPRMEPCLIISAVRLGFSHASKLLRFWDMIRVFQITTRYGSNGRAHRRLRVARSWTLRSIKQQFQHRRCTAGAFVAHILRRVVKLQPPHSVTMRMFHAFFLLCGRKDRLLLIVFSIAFSAIVGGTLESTPECVLTESLTVINSRWPIGLMKKWLQRCVPGRNCAVLGNPRKKRIF